MGARQQDERRVALLSTGARIEIMRRKRGLSRPVLAGLVGRSPDWLKKIESGDRDLRSLPLLIALARALDVNDLSDLTGNDFDAPMNAWDKDVHHTVPAIRLAMRDVSFGSMSSDADLPILAARELDQRVADLWMMWHRSSAQRSDVGAALPLLIRQAHSSIRSSEGDFRRQCRSVTADLYRLVQRLLAHICEPELHALAVERGRALSEETDTPMSLAQATWASSVDFCAAGHYDLASLLADRGAEALLKACGDRLTPAAMGTLGALQLEAAAAHGLAGHEGDAYRYLDAAAATARRMPAGTWHLPSAFDRANVEIMAVIIATSLHHNGEAITRAQKLDLSSIRSVVRRSRLLLELAQAQANKRNYLDAVRSLDGAAKTSLEAVALIPWARTLADELAERTPPASRAAAQRLSSTLKTVS